MLDFPVINENYRGEVFNYLDFKILKANNLFEYLYHCCNKNPKKSTST